MIFCGSTGLYVFENSLSILLLYVSQTTLFGTTWFALILSLQLFFSGGAIGVAFDTFTTAMTGGGMPDNKKHKTGMDEPVWSVKTDRTCYWDVLWDWYGAV